MIFRTIDTDATNLTKKMGLLGKSFKDIRKDYSNGLGITKSLFFTSISESDWKSLQKFNSAIKVTNDGLTKSQRITKAWNENMTGCSITAKRMGNDLVTGKKKISDVSLAMKTATASTKALEIAMNVFANVGLMLAITAVTKVVSELVQAQNNAVETAKEATSAYNDELSSIKNYKEKVSELNEELNSGNLSYEETKTKRSELMSIQDELIEKFGTEKKAIESVTEAINGQVNALNDLNERSYRNWIAKADDETIWTKLLPWGKSGLDQAIDYMESKKTVSFLDMANANSATQDKYQAPITDEIRSIQEEIDKTIQSKYNLEKVFATFKLTGTPEEIKSQLEAIRQDYLDLSKEAFLKNGISSKYWDAYRSEAIESINDVINQFDEGLEKHQEIYKTYIEGMVKYDSEYSDEYATILRKRAELEDAENSGNAEKIQKARQEFIDAIAAGITASESDENIKKYFESLYPELQAEFANWNFEIAINANTDNLKDEAEEIGKQYSATDLLDMINTEGVQQGEESFNKLINKAIEYGVCTDNSSEEVQKLIDLLVELGIVQGNIENDVQHETKPLSFTEAISNVQALSAGFDQLDKIYADVLNKEDFDWSSILNNTSFTEAFGECKDAYDEFIKTVANSPDDIDACQEAFNNLATAYIENKGVLNDLTEENKQATITMLEQMGIENAEEVVTATLAHNKEELTLQNVLLANSTMDLSTVTADEIQRLLDEGVVTEEVAKQLASYAVEKQYTNDKVINTEADCNNLIALMKTAEGTTTAVAKLEKLKARLYTTDANGNSVSRIISEEERKNVEKAINNIAAEFNAKVSETIKVPQMTYNGSSATQKIRDDLNKTADSAKKSADDLYNDLKNLIDAYMDYMEKSLDAGKIDYNTYCNSVKNYLDNLYHSGKLKAADYFDYVEKMLNKQKDIYDKVLSAVINRLDKEIDKWQKMIDALEAENDKLNDQKDTYDGILSAVEDVIDAESDRYQSLIDDLEEANDKLNKLKDDKDGILSAIADVYDNQIDALNKQSDAIQEQIDALQDKNDELDKQYNKEKAIYELEKAERLRNKKLYVAGKGYIYTQDQEAVRDARKNLDDIKTEELIDKLQKEKDNIADAIDNLQKYKEKWAEVTSAYEKEQNRQLALAQYGYDFEKTILLNRESDIEAFKNTYIAIQKELNDNSEMIDSYNEKVTYYNNLKKQWSDISGAYDRETNRQLAIAKWGVNYEQIILAGRIQDINAFKDAYLAIQQQIDDNTNLINSYNEKIDYYNKLKEQWQSITEEYDKQMNAQYASQVLGANWENDVLNGRLSTLDSFRTQYISVQQAIADAQWQSANEQIKALQALADAAWTSANEQINAAKEAQKAASGSTGSAGSVGSAYNVSGMISAGAPTSVINKITGNKSNTSAAATADQRKNNSNIIMSNEQQTTIKKAEAKKKKLANNIRMAKGGVVKIDPDDLLTNLAKQHGEDGFIMARNGERVLTPNQNASFEKFVDLITGMNVTPKMFTPDFTKFAMGTTTDNSSVIVNIGDINLQGVQNTEQLGDAIIKRLPGYITQKFNNKQR